MHKFALPLELGKEPDSGFPLFGFTINNAFVDDPYQSECGRFVVDPTEAHGLSAEDAAKLVDLNCHVVYSAAKALKEGNHALDIVPDANVVGPRSVAEFYQAADAIAQYLLDRYNRVHGLVLRASPGRNSASHHPAI